MTRAFLCVGGPLNRKAPPASIIPGQQQFLATPKPEPGVEIDPDAPVIKTRYELVILEIGTEKARFPVYVADGHDRSNLLPLVKQWARL